LGSRGVTGQPPRLLAVVAPEVAAQIVARRAAGDSVAVIGRDLHMRPGEVAGVLHAAQANAQSLPTAEVVATAPMVMQARGTGAGEPPCPAPVPLTSRVPGGAAVG
jgi:hypothetical protein